MNTVLDRRLAKREAERAIFADDVDDEPTTKAPSVPKGLENESLYDPADYDTSRQRYEQPRKPAPAKKPKPVAAKNRTAEQKVTKSNDDAAFREALPRVFQFLKDNEGRIFTYNEIRKICQLGGDNEYKLALNLCKALARQGDRGVYCATKDEAGKLESCEPSGKPQVFWFSNDRLALQRRCEKRGERREAGIKMRRVAAARASWTWVRDHPGASVRAIRDGVRLLLGTVRNEHVDEALELLVSAECLSVEKATNGRASAYVAVGDELAAAGKIRKYFDASAPCPKST